MSVDRGFTWLDDETLALIDIWGKDDIQSELITAKRNFPVYEKIAAELSEVGFSRTAYQCREKIKRLRKEYHIARYCVQHKVKQKKPMKYFDKVDEVFQRESEHENQDLHNIPLSDPEEEWHFNLKAEFESSIEGDDNLGGKTVVSSSSLEGGLKMRIKLKSDESSRSSNDNHPPCNNDDDDVQDCHTSPDNSPWVPDVVLVENSSNEPQIESNSNDNIDQENESSNSFVLNFNKAKSSVKVEKEPVRKKFKYDSSKTWFNSVMDQVTEKFIHYQENVDNRFLERIVSLERERIKKDEAVQQLWIEFEEKRRQEERQHEAEVMALFGQFISQVIYSTNNSNS